MKMYEDIQHALITKLLETNKLSVEPKDLVPTLIRILEDYAQQQNQLIVLDRAVTSYRSIVQEMAKHLK